MPLSGNKAQASNRIKSFIMRHIRSIALPKVPGVELTGSDGVRDWQKSAIINVFESLGGKRVRLDSAMRRIAYI